MSVGKKRYRLLPCDNAAAYAVARRNFLYINWTCRCQRHCITPSCLHAGCLFTQQKATWEGVLPVVSETMWPYLEGITEINTAGVVAQEHGTGEKTRQRWWASIFSTLG